MVGGVVLALVSAPLAAHAQPPRKVYRLGVLRNGSPPPAPDRQLEAFRRGLLELGYVEGKDVVLELRWAEGQVDRLPALAADLVRLRSDVIVAGGSEAVQAARKATATIPIVMTFIGYPIELGFIASLARPGGNVTGLSNLNFELDIKRVELLREVAPKIARLAVLWNPPQPAHEGQLGNVERAARSLGVQLRPIAVRSSGDLEGAFATMRRDRVGAVTMLPSALHAQSFRRIAGLALEARLPAVSWQAQFADVGGLMAYGPNQAEMARRAATYVDRILKGARPADLPVEQPTKLELVINLRAARALGLTIPQTVLLQVDQMVE
ncbi:MAG: ABC transporter substrate-binding protein [Candidatus Rokuibacteriota bacterium]